MTTKTLPISAELALPLDAVTQRLGFLGQSGSGKSYGAMRLAELMLEVGAQVVAVDPVGPWWGLRAAADGKHVGFPITVFGGIHGDLPLTPEAGALIADVVVDRGISAVIDVSDFTAGQQHRFTSDFAERFFERKKRAPSPVHVYFEEAQTFCPEKLPPDPNAAKMLHRVVRLVKVGRNYGIGTTLITQRPQATSKEALTQIACLFAMRTLGKPERKAIDAWLGDNLDAGGRPEDVDRLLRTLDTGQAWVASPHWLGVAKVVRISRKVTFDSSATPRFGVELPAPKVLAPVDVEALRTAMATVVEQAQKDDPTALRRRVSLLEAELAKARTARVAPAPPRVVEKPVLQPDDIERLERGIARLGEEAAKLDAIRDRLAQAQQVVVAQADNLATTIRSALRPVLAPHPAVAPPRSVARLRVEREHASGDLPRGARDMLTALASTMLPSLTRQQVAMLAGLKVSGGTFAKYLSILRTGGLAEDVGDGLVITDAGLAAIGGRPPQPQNAAELAGMWKSKLPGKARDMLDVVVGQTPAGGITRTDLAAAVAVEESGGTFAKYLSLLSTNGLVTKHGGRLRAVAELTG